MTRPIIHTRIRCYGSAVWTFKKSERFTEMQLGPSRDRFFETRGKGYEFYDGAMSTLARRYSHYISGTVLKPGSPTRIFAMTRVVVIE